MDNELLERLVVAMESISENLEEINQSLITLSECTYEHGYGGRSMSVSTAD